MKFVDKNELGPNPEYFSALKFKNLDLSFHSIILVVKVPISQRSEIHCHQQRKYAI